MIDPEVNGIDNDNKTAADIEKYGLSVIMIEASEYLPSFAYSIGLWQKYKHPEIICFGFKIQTLHALINNVADIVKSGNEILVGKTYNEIFENNKAEFLKVDPRNLSDYFGTAINYYGAKDFPALQLVWTDKNNLFPWEKDFESNYLYKQPLLDRNAEYKFREAENVTTFTTRQWLEEQMPIVRVVHNYDGYWQFLTRDQMPEDIKIVALKQLILRDKTLNEIFNLDYGQAAERDSVGGKWIRSNFASDEDV
jgi:hypothetical protein